MLLSTQQMSTRLQNLNILNSACDTQLRQMCFHTHMCGCLCNVRVRECNKQYSEAPKDSCFFSAKFSSFCDQQRGRLLQLLWTTLIKVVSLHPSQTLRAAHKSSSVSLRPIAVRVFFPGRVNVMLPKHAGETRKSRSSFGLR